MGHKVYLVIRQNDYGRDRVVGVYTTKTLADKESEKQNVRRSQGVLYYVLEMAVDNAT